MSNKTFKITVPKELQAIAGSRQAKTEAVNNEALLTVAPTNLYAIIRETGEKCCIVGVAPATRSATLLTSGGMQTVYGSALCGSDQYLPVQPHAINEGLFTASTRQFDFQSTLVENKQKTSYFLNQSLQHSKQLARTLQHPEQVLKELEDDFKRAVTTHVRPYDVVTSQKAVQQILFSSVVLVDEAQFKQEAARLLSSLPMFKTQPQSFAGYQEITKSIRKTPRFATENFHPALEVMKKAFDSAVALLRNNAVSPVMNSMFGECVTIAAGIDDAASGAICEKVKQIATENQILINKLEGELNDRCQNAINVVQNIRKNLLPLIRLMFCLSSSFARPDRAFDAAVQRYVQTRYEDYHEEAIKALIDKQVEFRNNYQSGFMLGHEIDDLKAAGIDPQTIQNRECLLTILKERYLFDQELKSIGTFGTAIEAMGDFSPFKINAKLVYIDGAHQYQPPLPTIISQYTNYVNTVFELLDEQDLSVMSSWDEQLISTVHKFKISTKSTEIFLGETTKENIVELAAIIESSLQMIADTYILHLNYDTEESEIFAQDEARSQIGGFIHMFSENNELMLEKYKNDNFTFTDMMLIKLKAMYEQQDVIVSLDAIQNIIHKKLAIKRLITEGIRKKCYYYAIIIDSSSIIDFFMKKNLSIIETAKNQLFQQLDLLANSMIENMRIVNTVLHDYEKKPDKFYILQSLYDNFGVESCMQFYSKLIAFWTNLSMQTINIFLLQDDAVLINKLYQQSIDLSDFQEYMRLREIEDAEDIVHTNKTLEFKYYKLSDIKLLERKKWNKFQTTCKQVQLTKLDDIQFSYAAFHKLTREVRISEAVYTKRHKAYNIFLSILEQECVRKFQSVQRYIQNNLFKGLAAISAPHVDSISIRRKSVVSYDEPAVKFEEVEMYLQLCPDDSPQLLKRFEHEFLMEFQKNVRIPLYSTNVTREKTTTVIPTPRDPLLIQIFTLSQINKTIINYTKMVHSVVSALHELLLLYRMQSQWIFWLNQTKQRNDEDKVIMEIRDLIKMLSPIQQLLNNFIVIQTGHDIASRLQIYKYPKKSVLYRLSQYYESMCTFKENYGSFLFYLNQQNIRYDKGLLRLFDHFSVQLRKTIPEISSICTVTHDYMLPQQYTEISKKFLFIDAGLQIKASDLFNFQNQYDFRQSMFLMKQQANLDQRIYLYLDQILEAMKKVYMQCEQQKFCYRVSFNPTSYIDQCNKFQQYLACVFQSYQFEVHNQLIIYSRDLESMIIWMKEYFYLIQRIQFLISDLVCVKNYGNVIKIDLNELTEHYCKIQVKQKKEQRNKKDTRSDLQKAIDYLKSKIEQERQQVENQRLMEFSILSSQDQLLITQSQTTLRDFVLKIVSKDPRVISLYGNTSVFKLLQKQAIELEQIQKRILSEPFTNIFKAFVNRQQQKLTNVTVDVISGQYSIFDPKEIKSQTESTEDEMRRLNSEKLINYQNYKLYQNQLQIVQYPEQGIIIPQNLDNVFPSMLLFNTSPINTYGDESLLQLFIEDPYLHSTFFDNISKFVIEISPIRGSVVTKLESDCETFNLEKYAKCPDVLYKFPDIIYEEVHNSFISLIVNCSNMIKQKQYESACLFPYQIMLYVIYLLEEQQLSDLKEYIKNNKKQTLIPIACRIEEKIQQMANVKYEFVDDEFILMPYNLQLGKIWGGKPKQQEFSMLTKQQFNLCDQILKGIVNRSTIFLCSHCRENSSQKRSIDQVCSYFERLLAVQIVRVFLCSDKFKLQFKEIIKYVLTGHMVILHNLELLKPQQVAELVDIIMCVQNRQGSIDFAFQIDVNIQRINEIIEARQKQGAKKSKNEGQYELMDEDLILRNIEIKDKTKQLGYILIYANCIDDLPPETVLNDKLDQNILVLSDSQKYQILFNQFRDTLLLNITTLASQSFELAQKDFVQANSAIGMKLYNLSFLMDKFNEKFAKLHTCDVNLISQLVNNPNDSFIVAAATLDVLMRQYINSELKQQKPNKNFVIKAGFQDYSDNNIKQQQKLVHQMKLQQRNQSKVNEQNTNFSLIANLISSIFGLAKQQQSQLNQQAKAFSALLDKSRGKNRIKQLSFNKYFQLFLQPCISHEASQFIHQFALINQVSFSLAYEVFLLNALFVAKKPVYIQCKNIEYIEILCIYAQNVSGKKTHVVNTYHDLCSKFATINPEDLVCVIPTSNREFQRIMDKIQQQLNCKLIIQIPNDVTQQQLLQCERRFVLLADFSECFNISTIFIYNKTFNFDINAVKLIHLDQNRYIRKAPTTDNLKHQLKYYRLSFVSNVFVNFYHVILQLICQTFSIGLSYDEFLLIRTISDFFLLRQNIIQAKPKEIDFFEKLVNQPSVQYIEEEILEKIHKTDDMLKLLQVENRAYAINQEISRHGFVGFQQDDLQTKQIRISDKLKANPKQVDVVIQTLNSFCNQGRGSQTFNFTFTDYFFQKVSEFDSTFDLIQYCIDAIVCSLLNAAILYCQFSQILFVPERKYDSFKTDLREFDPEKLKDPIADLYMKVPIQVILYEHNQNIFKCQEADIKNKYTQSQNIYKAFFSQLFSNLPPFSQKQFSYLSLEANGFAFNAYTFGKGVLNNIDIDKFIKLQQVEFDITKEKEKSEEKSASDVDQSIEDRMKKIQNISFNHLSQEDDDLEVSSSVKFEELKEDVDVQKEFEKQFDPHFQQSIDLQQSELDLPIYFDDERIALSVLLACCMLCPITVGFVGDRFSGKTTILKAAKLIVRDLGAYHFGYFSELNSQQTVFAFQTWLLQNYIRTIAPNTKNVITFQEQNLVEENISKIINTKYYQLLSLHDREMIKKLNLFDFEDVEQQVATAETILSVENQLADDKYQDIQVKDELKIETNEVITAQQKPVFLYYETQAFPSFVLHYSAGDPNEVLSDNIMTILRDHVCSTNICSAETKFRSLSNDVINNKMNGSVDISDTSFIIEFTQLTDVEKQNSLSNTFSISFQMPKLNISFLRKYFKYLQSCGFSQMNEEWVLSFLNGLNLISSDLPTKIFSNYLFFKRILSGQTFHLPSYKTLVREQQAVAKLEKVGIQTGVNRIIDNIKPDIWAIIVSNYEKFSIQFDKIRKETKFIDFLKNIIFNLMEQKNRVTTQQHQMLAVNQDHIFQTLNIYSLINALKVENVSNVRMLSLLERFTSLNLLGYLHFIKKSVMTNKMTTLKIVHPWQDTQQHHQLYTSLQAILVQALLTVSRQKEETGIGAASNLQKSFGNNFAQRMYKYTEPLQRSQAKVALKLPLSKIFKQFLKPNLDQISLEILVDNYVVKHSLNLLFNAGLIASNMVQTNPFFNGHIIQLYQQCADSVDPLLLQQIFQLSVQIAQIKERNIAIFKTQVITHGMYKMKNNRITNHHAHDYLLNYKRFIIEFLGKVVVESISNQSKPKTGQEEEEEYEEDSDEEDSANEFEDENESEFDIEKDQNFGGFQSSMLNCIKIPQFILKLSSNTNANSYNMFIQIFSQLTLYKVMSNETFKNAFQQMAKVEDFEGDISDNQSNASRSSSLTAETKFTTASKNSVSSSIVNKQFEEEMIQIGNMNVVGDSKAYQISRKAFRFLTNRQHDKKLIVDIQNILQTLNTTTTTSKKKKDNETDTTNDIVNYLKQFVNELQQNDQISVDSIEYLVILQIIRFSILLALGIRPTLIFNPNQYQKTQILIPYSTQTNIIGISFNSPLQQLLPISQQQSGYLYGDAGLLPNQFSQRQALYIPVIKPKTIQGEKGDLKFYEKIQGLSFPDFDPEHQEIVTQKLNEFYDVLLICPKSILLRQSRHGGNLFLTLQQLFQSDSFIQCVFDAEEIQNILKLTSINLGFNHMFNIKDLSAFLSIMYSLLVIDDEPIVSQAQVEYQSINESGLQNLGQVTNIIEHMTNATEIAAQQHCGTESQIPATKFNAIDYKQSDILFLFQVSNCPLPQEYAFSRKAFETHKQLQTEFARCVAEMYKLCSQFSSQPLPSFFEFVTVNCTIVNNINNQYNNVVTHLNFIALFYKYYEQLAAPSQQKLKQVDLKTFSIANIVKQIPKQVQERSELMGVDPRTIAQVIKVMSLDNSIKNEKAVNLDIFEQLLTSTVENVQIRNYCFMVYEKIRSLFQLYECYQRSSVYDAVLTSMYMLFRQNESISEQKIYDYLTQTSRTKGENAKIIAQLPTLGKVEFQKRYDLFLIFGCSLLQQAGFDVDITQKLELTQKQVYLAMHKCDRNAIHNCIVNVNSFDVPVLPILKHLNISQKEDDPDLRYLYDLLIASQVMHKSILFVDQKILQASACLLEAIKKRENVTQQFSVMNLKTIEESRLNQDDKKPYTFEILRKLLFIDMQSEPKEFNALLARVVSMSDNLIVVANFSKANPNNLATFRKFVQLRSRRVIQKRQTLFIGNHSSVSNLALHRFKIIVSYSNEHIFEDIKKAGLYNQEFIDQISIIGSIYNTKSESIDDPFQIAQKILQSVFSERNTFRYVTEEYRCCLARQQQNLSECRKSIMKYFWFNLFDENFRNQKMKSGTTQGNQQMYDQDGEFKEVKNDNIVNMQDEEVIDKVNSYISTQKGIIETSVQKSITLNQLFQQVDEMTTVLTNLKESFDLQEQRLSFIVESQNKFQRETINKQKQLEVLAYRSPKVIQNVIKKYDTLQNSKINVQNVVQQIGYGYSLQNALCISFILRVMKNLAKKYIQTTFILGGGIIDYICDQIKINTNVIINDYEEKQKALTKKQQAEQIIVDPSLINVYETFQLEYCISTEKQTLNEFLIAQILPILQKLICPILPRQLASAMYFVINLIFFSLLQNDDYLKSIDDISLFLENAIISMHSTQIDDIRMIVGSQILSVFSEKTKYGIEYSRYRNLDFVTNIIDFMPQITQMSEILQESWLRLITLQKNQIVDQVLPWFLKHHSTFVIINQCQNLFAAFLLYWRNNEPEAMLQLTGEFDIQKTKKKEDGEPEPEEAEEAEENSEDEAPLGGVALLLKTLLEEQLNDERQINQLPKQLMLPTPQAIFTAFLISNVLQPHLLEKNVKVFQFLMLGFLNIQQQLNQDALFASFYQSVQNSVSGTIKRSRHTPQNERGRIIAKISQDFGSSFMSLLNYSNDTTQTKKLPTALICEATFVLSEVLSMSSSEIVKHLQKVKQVMERDDYDPQKHDSFIATIGPSPNNFFLIFYDEAIDIRSILQHVYRTFDVRMFRNVPLIYASTFSIAQSRDQLVVATADPLHGGIAVLEGLTNYATIKQTIYPTALQMPIIVLIPNQRAYIDDVTHSCFTTALAKFTRAADPGFSFVHAPQTLSQQLSHSVQVAMQQVCSRIVQRTPSVRSQRVAIAIIRQLVLQHTKSLQPFDTELTAQLNQCLDGQASSCADLHRDIYEVQQLAKLGEDMAKLASPLDAVLWFVGRIFRSARVSVNKDHHMQVEEATVDLGFIQAQDEAIFQEKETARQLGVADEEDLNFREDSQPDEREMEAQLDNQTTEDPGMGGNDVKDDVEGQEEVEQTAYENVLTQLQLHEMHRDIIGQLDVPRIESRIVQAVTCGKRVLKIRSADDAAFQVRSQVKKMFQTCQENVYTQLVEPIKLLDGLIGQPTVSFYRAFVSSEPLAQVVYGREAATWNYPALLQQFIRNLNGSDSASTTKQLAPQRLFRQLVHPQVNRAGEAVLGGARFGIFADQWVFNTSCFGQILEEIFIFIKFRTSIVTGSSFGCQRLVLLLEKKQITCTSEGIIRIEPDKGELKIVFREVELFNGVYDNVLQTLVDENYEQKLGYRQITDVYCYSITCDKRELEMPEGYKAIPLKVDGRLVASVYVRAEGPVEDVYMGISAI